MSALARLVTYELRALLRGRAARAAWMLLLLAGLLAVAQGHWQMQGQRAVLAELPAIHQADVAALQQRFPQGTDSGSIAYYLFMPASHAADGWADLAVGIREQAPVAMKVRMLGLYAQLFDAELVNPRLAAAGSYDFAFFILLIMPLWMVLLCHGVLARDEETGTGSLLRAQAASLWRLVLLRVGLRWLIAWLACALLLGMAVIGTAAEADARLPAALLLMALYLAFWAALCVLIVALRRSSVWSATALLGLWAVLILILPQALSALNERLHPVGEAAAMVLKQRDVMHTGWDLPKETTFERFFRSHPEWQDTPPVTERFHWKWYFAMQQVADDAVRADVAEYRARLMAREGFAATVASLVPSVGIQRGFTAMAGAELTDHLGYLDSVERYHDSLRQFFYPRLFQDEPAHFPHAAFADVPRHQTYRPERRWPWAAALGMLVWVVLLLSVAHLLLRRPPHSTSRRAQGLSLDTRSV